MRPTQLAIALTLGLVACTPVYPDVFPLPPDHALVPTPATASTQGVVLASGDTAWWDYQVTRTAEPLERIAPEYSEFTRSRGAEGKVVARFAVDERGAPLMTTFTIVSSPDYVLSEAVQQAVAKAHFRPAELHGRPVVQVVELPFNFTLQK